MPVLEWISVHSASSMANFRERRIINGGVRYEVFKEEPWKGEEGKT